MFGIILVTDRARQRNGLIANDARVAIDRFRIDTAKLSIRLGACNEESQRLMRQVKPGQSHEYHCRERLKWPLTINWLQIVCSQGLDLCSFLSFWAPVRPNRSGRIRGCVPALGCHGASCAVQSGPREDTPWVGRNRGEGSRPSGNTSLLCFRSVALSAQTGAVARSEILCGGRVGTTDPR